MGLCPFLITRERNWNKGALGRTKLAGARKHKGFLGFPSRRSRRKLKVLFLLHVLRQVWRLKLHRSKHWRHNTGDVFPSLTSVPLTVRRHVETSGVHPSAQMTFRRRCCWLLQHTRAQRRALPRHRSLSTQTHSHPRSRAPAVASTDAAAV